MATEAGGGELPCVEEEDSGQHREPNGKCSNRSSAGPSGRSVRFRCGDDFGLTTASGRQVDLLLSDKQLLSGKDPIGAVRTQVRESRTSTLLQAPVENRSRVDCRWPLAVASRFVKRLVPHVPHPGHVHLGDAVQEAALFVWDALDSTAPGGMNHVHPRAGKWARRAHLLRISYTLPLTRLHSVSSALPLP